MTTMRRSDLPANALPTRALRGHGIVELMDLSGTSFNEPFYDHSLVALCEKSSPWKVLTSFQSLTRLTRVEALAPPGLFIFNTGRCGSTLLGNMFKEHPAVRMTQEPDVVNRFLADGRPFRSDSDDGRALRAIISSFGRGLGPGHAVVFKFSSWNVVEATTLLELFPHVPVVFLWRSAVPVVASYLTNPPAYIDWYELPERRARWLGSPVAGTERTRRSLVAFYACAWRAVVVAGLELSKTHGNRVHLLSYEQLRTRPDEVATFLAGEFGIPCPPEVVAAMASRKHVYSKDFGRSAKFDPSAHTRDRLSTTRTWR